jgi:hypothetical protein
VKTAKKTSPTARALAQLRKEGHVAAVTEKWNQFAKIRQDLFGFIDLIYLTGVQRFKINWKPASDFGNIVAVQVTTGDNHAKRRTKLLAEPRALIWLQSGGLIEVWSYTKAGAKDKRKLWTLRREEIVADDFKVSG